MGLRGKVSFKGSEKGSVLGVLLRVPLRDL